MASLGRQLQPGNRLEAYSWLFMRVSGVILLLAAVFHLLWMHLVIGVDHINFEIVARRWENPLWRVFDLTLLIFALVHGTNGTRWVLEDYIQSPGWQILAKWFLYVLAIIVGAMGAFVIFAFETPA
jgi:succinate dehydrogenase / fumarate reductase membrane anchor subunit